MVRIAGVRIKLLALAFLLLAVRAAGAQPLIFQDGFASGSNCVWSQSVLDTAQAIEFGTTTGDTASGSNGLAASCLLAGAPEKVYRFTAPASGALHLLLQPFTSADLAVSVRTSCAPAGEILCLDSNPGGATEAGDVAVAAGADYMLVVDGVAVGESGPYDLTISLCGDGQVEPPEVCDGADLDGESCQTLGYSGGVLGCQSDCFQFEISGCIP